MSFNQRGFTLAGALTLIAVMSILLALAVPLWSRVKLRDNEEELIFRGKEYVEAITRYQQRFGAYPPDLETLQKLKFIRRLYADPMTKSGKWKVIHPDSLVQTGEAGKINQPGQQNSGDDDDDENNDRNNDRNKSLQPFDFGNQNKNDSEGMNEDDSDEEPEVESTGPVVGVASRSKKASIKVYNGQSAYNKWAFTFSVPQELQKVNPVPKPGTKSGAKQDPGKNLKPGSFQSNPLPGQNPDPNPGDDDEDEDEGEDEER